MNPITLRDIETARPRIAGKIERTAIVPLVAGRASPRDFSQACRGRRGIPGAWADHCRLRPGRRAPSELTVADLTGTGVQDTAIATLARDRTARAGTTFES
jgi:hypothetical protein